MSNNKIRRVVTLQDMHERVCDLESAQTKMSASIVRVDGKVDRLDGKVDTLVQFALEDREARAVVKQTELEETGKTERVRLGSRARIVISLATALGTVFGGGVVAALIHACS